MTLAPLGEGLGIVVLWPEEADDQGENEEQRGLGPP